MNSILPNSETQKVPLWHNYILREINFFQNTTKLTTLILESGRLVVCTLQHYFTECWIVIPHSNVQDQCHQKPPWGLPHDPWFRGLPRKCWPKGKKFLKQAWLRDKIPGNGRRPPSSALMRQFPWSHSSSQTICSWPIFQRRYQTIKKSMYLLKIWIHSTLWKNKKYALIKICKGGIF